MKVSKRKLESISAKYNRSVQILMSSEKILSFLVNDILDYAQISSGRFRKLYSRFNIKDCVEEIMMILQFKAKKIGISLVLNVNGFQEDGRPII